MLVHKLTRLIVTLSQVTDVILPYQPNRTGLEQVGGMSVCCLQRCRIIVHHHGMFGLNGVAPFLACWLQHAPPPRFSKDQGTVDDLLPFTIFDAMQIGFMVLSALVLVAIAVPVILPVFVPLAVAFIWLRARYLCTSREVKRWEATTR